MDHLTNASAKDKYLSSSGAAETTAELMHQAEKYLSRLDGSPNPAGLILLETLDRIEEKISNDHQQLQDTALSIQYDYVLNQVKKSAGVILNSFENVDVLYAERSKNQSGFEHWWWYPDRLLSERKNRNFRKLLIMLFVVLIFGALIFLAYDKFIAPPPEVRLRLDHEATLDTTIENGDMAEALLAANEAVKQFPDHAPFWIKKGILEEIEAMPGQAAKSFDQALKILPRENFLLQRSNAYILFGLNKELLADASEIVHANPQSAEGYLFQAIAYENLNQVQEAGQAYQTALNLAEEQNKAQLAATIKVKQALFLQYSPLPTKQ